MIEKLQHKIISKPVYSIHLLLCFALFQPGILLPLLFLWRTLADHCYTEIHYLPIFLLALHTTTPQGPQRTVRAVDTPLDSFLINISCQNRIKPDPPSESFSHIINSLEIAHAPLSAVQMNWAMLSGFSPSFHCHGYFFTNHTL